MNDSFVEIKQEGDIIWIGLNNPSKGNALSIRMVAEISDALDKAKGENCRLVVFHGLGKNFCTGFDLSDLESQSDDLLLARFIRIELLLQKIYSAPFPSIAIGHGNIVGAGADIFVACEQRYSHGEISITFPGPKFGIVLGNGRLSAITGSAVAREILSQGRKIEKNEAIAIGLVNKAFSSREVVMDAIKSTIESLRNVPRETLVLIREATLERGIVELGADLRLLALSASKSGLKQRIVDYRNSFKSGK